MRCLQNLLLSAALVLVTVVSASAQTESELKSYFEGMRVEVKIDMPATKDGINVYPERDRTVDFNRYGDLLKDNGIAFREGDRIMITKVKVKDKHIEFQLGGGGYGTFGDESTPSAYVSPLGKSYRERWIEREIDRESNDRRRRQLREELYYLRRDRQRQDDYNRARAAENAEIAKIRIQEKRLQGGSRFNIKFDRKLSEQDLTPQMIMDALSRYVYFPEMP
jgi:hypothetical protein